MPVGIGLLVIVSFFLARPVNRYIHLSTARAELGRQKALHLVKKWCLEVLATEKLVCKLQLCRTCFLSC